MKIDLFPLVGGLLGAAVVVVIFRFFKRSASPAFGYSSLQLFPPFHASIRHPFIFYGGAALLFILALSNPRLMEKESIEQGRRALLHEGIAVYLVLDRSGSMATQVVIGSERFVSKIDLLKEVTEEFIKERSTDLVGLIAFARKADILSPLTADHEQVLKQLQQLKVVQDKQQDGTAIGYAIAKAATMIEATRQFAVEDSSYQLKGAAIVLVTDGFQSPHPEDKGNPLRAIGLVEAAQLAKRANAHLYIISIDPLINEDEYAPQRRIMQRAVEEAGGEFFGVADPATLSSIYKKISLLEPSQIGAETGSEFMERTKIRFYFFFVLAGLLFLVWGCIRETVFFRSLP